MLPACSAALLPPPPPPPCVPPQAYDKKKHKHTVVYADDGNKEYINLITTGGQGCCFENVWGMHGPWGGGEMLFEGVCFLLGDRGVLPVVGSGEGVEVRQQTVWIMSNASPL
jgi:hypothetical protein